MTEENLNKDMLEDYIKYIDALLKKEKLNDIDISICCLQLRLCLEHIFYKKLFFYKKYLSEAKFNNYSVTQIIKYILPLDISLTKKSGINNGSVNIKFIGKNNNCFANITSQKISTNDIRDMYNTLGKFLHITHPNEKKQLITKDKLLKYFSTIKQIKENLFSFTAGMEIKCLNCGKEITIPVDIEEFFCPECFVKYCNNNQQPKIFSDMKASYENQEIIVSHSSDAITQQIKERIAEKTQNNQKINLAKDLIFEYKGFDNDLKEYKVKFGFGYISVEKITN